MSSINVTLRPLRRGASRCSKSTTLVPYVSRRCISEGWLKKVVQKEMDFKARQKEVLEGKRQSFLSMLEERGLVHQIAGNRDELESLMNRKSIGVYCGVDPTAPSLHIGHMLPVMILYWTYVHDYGTFHLIGGATAKIGDPSGRSTERDKMHRNTRSQNILLMQDQLKKLWVKAEYYAARYGFVNKKPKKTWLRGLYNNSTWHNKCTLSEVLSELGRGIRISTLLSRDSVKERLEKGDGMNTAEFFYPLMQSWDWWQMFQQKGVQLQIGGQDQYGNLMTGREGVTYLSRNASHDDQRINASSVAAKRGDYEFYGITTPLLTTASGQKLGKSEGNALWLDPNLTKPFELYQHFVRLPDDVVEQYLKWFTFLPIQDISIIMAEHNKDASKRLAQHFLAHEFTELIHGWHVAEVTRSQTKDLFPNTVNPFEYFKDLLPNRLPATSYKPPIAPRDPAAEVVVPEKDAKKQWAGMSLPELNKYGVQHTAMDNMHDAVKMPRNIFKQKAWPWILYVAGLTNSRAEGARLMANGGAYVHAAHGGNQDTMDQVKWNPVTDPKLGASDKFIVDGVLMIRAGKWNVRIIDVVDDKVWETEGLQLPERAQQAEAEAKKLQEEKEVGQKGPKGVIRKWPARSGFSGNKPDALSGFSGNH